MSNVAAEKEKDKIGLDRIVFFTDAVIAIVITLLIIDIKPPEIEAELVTANLTRAVLALWPKYLGFIVSFWVIAGYWVAHHLIFRFIKDYDHGLIYINLLLLMWVAFMPFTTALLFDYPAQTLTVIVYAGIVAAAGLTMLWLWGYATHHHRLVEQTLEQSTIKSISRSLLISPGVFLISMGIALFNPDLAMNWWLILLLYYLIFRPAR